ncbi:MAG: hypothetical protein M1272_07845 [Firmicutes bacterium]|nr:hypothetical protein [Bacillota bacterium]
MATESTHETPQQCWNIFGIYAEGDETYQSYVLTPMDWSDRQVLEAMALREEAQNNLITAEFLRFDAEATRVNHRLIGGELFVAVGMAQPLSGEPPVVEPSSGEEDID